MSILQCDGLTLRFAVMAMAALGGQGALLCQEAARSPLMNEEQNGILDRVRAYASSYVSQLPNFVCVERTRRKLAEAKGKPYKPVDELEDKVSFVEGRETYERLPLQTIGKGNGKRGFTPKFEVRGEFGTLMRAVLVLDHASFSWLGWDHTGNVRTAVFAYRVSKDQSTMAVTNGRTDRAIVAYHGLVFAEPEKGAVVKLTADAEDIPERFSFSKAVSVLSYGAVEIAGKSYLLPVTSVYSGLSTAGLFRNESEFRDYKKFGSESRIKFGEEK
jgi:hypothetical protein